MNKKLLAVMIGSALAGSISIAQADVQLYGQVDASVDSHDCTNSVAGCFGYTRFQGFQSGDKSQKINMNGNFSFFGIKGAEDLGNGLKAIFDVAFSFDPSGHQSAGSSTLSDNEKWLGVSGDFGTIRAGTVFTPYSDHGASLDPFYGTSLEANKAGLQSSGLHNEFSHSELASGGSMGGLVNKTLRYDSPDMNGLSGSVFYTFGGLSTNSNPSGNQHNPYGVGGQYKNGNILAFADYINSAEGSTKPSGAAIHNDTALDLGGRYAMGNIGLFGMYERGGLVFSDIAALTGRNNTYNTSNQWHLGGDFTMGNTLLYAAYGRGHAEVKSAAFDLKTSAWTLGVKHSLSLRTSVYAGYNRPPIACDVAVREKQLRRK